MDYHKIGAFIANLRKEKNLTQKDLADILHVTDRAISKWERGKGCPDISLLDDLSKTLDVSILEILRGERIDKKKQVENDELIYSMNYAEMNFKEKLKNIVDILSIAIVSFIALLLLFYNFRVYILLKQPYYHNIIFVGSDNLFKNVEYSIDIIKNTQGKYSDDEYQTLLSYIDSIKNIENDKELYYKSYYTFQDMKYVISGDYVKELSTLDILSINNLHVYKILDSYNENVNIIYDYYGNIEELERFVHNFYKYNFVYLENDKYQYYNRANYIKELVYYKYDTYYKILSLIIDGGDLLA